MRKVFFALSVVIFLFGPLGQAACPEKDTLIGAWQFYKIIYQGQERPPFNPNLILKFEFYGDGTNRLFWERVGERGFCERRGIFQYSSGLLIDKITWVNPNNNMDCSKDPDMQIGKESKTPIEFHDGDLHLILELSGEPFIYVWKRIELQKPQP